MSTNVCLLDESVCVDELGFMRKRGNWKQSGISAAFIEKSVFQKNPKKLHVDDLIDTCNHMKQQSETVHSEQNTSLMLELTVKKADDWHLYLSKY